MTTATPGEGAPGWRLPTASVQRVAHLLAPRGLAEYQPNPAHQRAKLLASTESGRAAIHNLGAAQHSRANRVTNKLSKSDLRQVTAAVDQLVAALRD